MDSTIKHIIYSPITFWVFVAILVWELVDVARKPSDSHQWEQMVGPALLIAVRLYYRKQNPVWWKHAESN